MELEAVEAWRPGPLLGDLLLPVELQGVPFLKVVEAVQHHTALVSRSQLADVVFEVAQARYRSIEYNAAVAR